MKKILWILFQVIEAVLAICGLLGILLSTIYPQKADKWSKELKDELNKDYIDWKNRKYTKVI